MTANRIARILLLLSPIGAVADETCTLSNATLYTVEYYRPTSGGDPNQCTFGKCSLWGWLYVPKIVNIGSYPVVLYSHGHGQDRKQPCEMADYFTGQGYVFFAPVRRGHSLENRQYPNTGNYIELCTCGNKDNDPSCLLPQTAEIQEAITYLSTYKDSYGKIIADVNRLALLGQSFGGSLTLMAAGVTLSPEPKAAVDISGAGEQWPNYGTLWASYLTPKIKVRKMPIFFLQPSNENRIDPTIQFSSEAANNGDHEFQAALFPPVHPYPGECTEKPEDCKSDGTLQDDVIHEAFVKRSPHVKRWGPAVVDFIRRYGVQTEVAISDATPTLTFKP